MRTQPVIVYRAGFLCGRDGEAHVLGMGAQRREFPIAQPQRRDESRQDKFGKSGAAATRSRLCGQSTSGQCGS